MSQYLYLDIETLPTNDPDIIAEIAAGITPPKTMSKAETIAAWEADVKPGLVKDAVAKTSFSGGTGRVCVIGWAWDNDEPSAFGVIGSEAEFLRSVFDMISEGADKRAYTVVVGHHVAGFDIRFLWQRCMVLGIKAPHWLPRDPKPWGNDVHDTMAMFAGQRDTISLDKLCRAMGVPGKTGMTGADVADAWARGEHERVAEYCRDDVARVRACHRKMLVALGEV